MFSRSFSNDDVLTTISSQRNPHPPAVVDCRRVLLRRSFSSVKTFTCIPPREFSRTTVAMADNVEGLIDVPREFLKDGVQFINKCQKRTGRKLEDARADMGNFVAAADKKEFIKISQAIAIGFLTMGTVGYVVKLIHIPINNILVGAA
ncbi:secE/SeC61-gamma subunits of protein translocation complex domain-containing protein [Purpureocillium lavendulum]|uniref:SecE/SeC61-gamma subunits of protein translocation complex domain-containing protein n=1 Tax=Purpureocillium lavendulum TaxID=1247861 RepID=A0AB34G690_9HYPO|nr:secE/SeC61-gamma subunits of protein translocation complex domain-containing protein [Purpureocillium lavendulum]